MHIKYITGNGAAPSRELYGDKMPVVFHIVNNFSAWGSGFVIAIDQVYGTGKDSPSWKYRSVCQKFFDDFNVDIMPLGFNQYVSTTSDQTGPVIVVNMFAQNGFPCKENPVAFCADAFDRCMYFMREYLVKKFGEDGFVLFSPRVGCGRGGAVWEDVEEIVRNTMDDLDVDYYVVDPDLSVNTL